MARVVSITLGEAPKGNPTAEIVGAAAAALKLRMSLEVTGFADLGIKIHLVVTDEAAAKCAVGSKVRLALPGRVIGGIISSVVEGDKLPDAPPARPPRPAPQAAAPAKPAAPKAQGGGVPIRRDGRKEAEELLTERRRLDAREREHGEREHELTRRGRKLDDREEGLRRWEARIGAAETLGRSFGPAVTRTILETGANGLLLLEGKDGGFLKTEGIGKEDRELLTGTPARTAQTLALVRRFLDNQVCVHSKGAVKDLQNFEEAMAKAVKADEEAEAKAKETRNAPPKVETPVVSPPPQAPAPVPAPAVQAAPAPLPPPPPPSASPTENAPPSVH